MADLKIKTAGYAAPGTPDSILRVGVEQWRCGHITDGVSFAHGKRGGWVVALSDLKRIVAAAEKARRALRGGE